ncbi:MAG: hypothetical protein VCC20_01285 [Myxococcota bacterium]
MRSRLLAIVVGLGVGLGVAEAGARLLEAGLPEETLFAGIGRRIDDPVLEYRTLPDTGENDARGYRNRESLERADVVVLGDSQTWGVNASLTEAWPSVLGELTGLRVYNMGRGGYGIVQYRHQLEQALSLEPSTLVVSLYLGNDIYDAYSLAYGLPAHEALRHPDPVVREAIARSPYPDLQRMFFDRLAHHRSSLRPVQWVTENTGLGRLFARATQTPADAVADRAWAAAHPDDGFVYEEGGISTVFHTSYRVAALATSLPKVREGLRITQNVLVDLGRRVAEVPETELLVVLIPTKERIFARAVSSAGLPTPGSYVRGVSEESKISAGLIALMQEEEIAYLDLLPVLEEVIGLGEAIFPANVDGHFTAQGYRRLAEAVASELAR